MAARGMSNVAYGLMTQELERGDSGLRSFVSVPGRAVMYPILSYGSDAQKTSATTFAAGQSDRLLWIDRAAVWIESRRDADARGEEGQQIYSERREDVGSPADRSRCGGRVGEGRGRQGPRISGRKRHAGIQTWDVHGKWSLRASVTSGLALTDCEIPEDNLLPGVVG